MAETEVFENCWQFWKCPEETKKKCPAFLMDSGKDCWTVSSSFIVPNRSLFKLGDLSLKKCFDCSWYKQTKE